MFKSLCKVVKKIDKLPDMVKSLEHLKNVDVLVGIPQAKATRKQGDPINNAELGFILSEGVHAGAVRTELDSSKQAGLDYNAALEAYVQSHGDPAYDIPPRPFLEPAIKYHSAEIAKFQLEIITAALAGDRPKVNIKLRTLGLYGQNIVKAWFTSPHNGWAPNAPSTIAKKGSDKPNIDSAQVRNSITYVIKDTP